MFRKENSVVFVHGNIHDGKLVIFVLPFSFTRGRSLQNNEIVKASLSLSLSLSLSFAPPPPPPLRLCHYLDRGHASDTYGERKRKQKKKKKKWTHNYLCTDNRRAPRLTRRACRGGGCLLSAVYSQFARVPTLSPDRTPSHPYPLQPLAPLPVVIGGLFALSSKRTVDTEVFEPV